VQKTPSSLRKLFNFWCGSCIKANDAVHKERQLRKRDSRMIRLMYENPSPTNRPPMPHAPSDEEDSEPENFESIWERLQQVDLATNKDYSDRANGNTYYNPTFGGMYSLDLHIQRFLSWAHKGKEHPLACLRWILMHKEVQALLVDTTIRECTRKFKHCCSVNPYEGMASHLPPFPPPPSFVPPSQFVPPPQDDDEEEP
jgi:hypothetical protein